MSVNDLVHITGWRDFKLRKLEILQDPHKLNDRLSRDNVVLQTLLPDADKQVFNHERFCHKQSLQPLSSII